jgi:CRP-like cAMP-binding protein
MFAVAASVVSIPYFLLQPTVLWAPLAWTIGFAGINLVQSWRLFLERQPVKLTAEEQELRQLAFRDVPPRKFLQVLNIGAWSSEPSDTRLLESGKVPDHLVLIVRGRVRVASGGSEIGMLGPGDFVGSALILTGLPADVDAVVDEPVRAVRWHIGTLERYLGANPEMRVVMQRHLARELSGKLSRTVQGAGTAQPGA